MSVLYLLIPLAVLFSALAVAAFLWAAHRGELDDLVTPAMRMLHDDDEDAKSEFTRNPRAQQVCDPPTAAPARAGPRCETASPRRRICR
jgi:cbb3-type cytochrome oxidase maturation protein